MAENTGTLQLNANSQYSCQLMLNLLYKTFVLKLNLFKLTIYTTKILNTEQNCNS